MTGGLSNSNKFTITLGVVTGVLLMAGVSSAETFAEAVRECQTITGQQERYQCYDEAEQDAVENVSRVVGTFNYELTSDPITGQKLHSLFLRSDRGLNRRRNPIELKLTCDSTRPNEYRLVLNWGEFLPSTNPEVTTRIGQGESVTGRWDTGRFRESTVFPGAEAGFSKTELINRLEDEVAAGNTSLVFRTTPYNYNAITAVFDVTGFNDVIGPIRSSCEF